MMKVILLILLIGVMQGVTAAYYDPGKNERSLRKHLLENYDKNTKPSGKTVINILYMTVKNFHMHESDHSVDLQTWFAHSWKDPRLKWNPSSQNNVSQIGIDPDDVWKPDLTVYNQAVGPSTLPKSQLPVLLYSSGEVLFVPVYHFHFTCIMDLTYWPHDVHDCSMFLGSWIHNGNLIDLGLSNFQFIVEIPSDVVGSGMNLSRTEWNISATKGVRQIKYYKCCVEPFVSVYLSMLITRNAPAYAWTVQMPAACLSILTLVMFLLPPGAGEKIIFGGLCLVLDLLYMDYTSYAINHAPSHTPLIVQMVCQQVVLLMISLIVSAIVMRVARDPHSTGIPPLIKGPVATAAYLLFLSNYGSLASGSYSSFARTVKPDEVELGDDCDGDICKREQIHRNEWIILAAVIDRLFFILYFAICIISLIRFSSVL